MVRWPGHVAAGVVGDGMVATYDWLPTLASLVGEADRVPSDRPIDGLDLSAFLSGEAESPREHFVFLGTDGEPVAVKWKTMKVHFRYTESDSWTAPLVKPQIPSVYDLFADPAETVNLMDTELTVSWVIGQAMRPLVELEQSEAEYPHVSVGEDFAGYDSA
jgi:arylsulfatase A-like enzyme